MQPTTTITKDTVSKIARLANIPTTDKEEEKLAAGFTTTMKVVDKLFQVDVDGVEPTNQVTGLENVFREDEVDAERMFTQDQALSNTKRKHNGFFVVDQVIEQDE
jgi:aspartyl-tRNA(Asn)/glutamyl-tRNA(Gln) amidotransferase subunit C